MSPDAKRRMEVYQEGKRAFNRGTKCPYTADDWRSSTWAKGWVAAHSWAQMPPSVTTQRDKLYCQIRSFGYTTSAQTYEIVDYLLKENNL